MYFFSNITSAIAGQLSSTWNYYYNTQSRESVDAFFIIFPMATVVIYAFILAMKGRAEKLMKSSIQVVVVAKETTKSGSKKTKIGISDSFLLMINSRLLLCMSLIPLFYNICSNLFDNNNAAALRAAAGYFGRDNANYNTKFKSFDTKTNAILTAIIILSPLSYLIDTRGIFAFSLAPLIVVLISAFAALIFGIMNLPISGLVMMWPFNNINFTVRRPGLESWVSTCIQIALKVSKYAFYDMVKEEVAMSIEPSLRPMVKGVYDGSMSKLGKFLGSFYGILIAMMFAFDDNRAYFTITFTMILAFCVVWYFCLRYVSKSFNTAKIN